MELSSDFAPTPLQSTTASNSEGIPSEIDQENSLNASKDLKYSIMAEVITGRFTHPASFTSPKPSGASTPSGASED